MTGKIKKLTDRGFGFIKRDDGQKDVFFFHKEVKNCTFDELREGDSVTFETEESERGPRAIKVCKP